MRLPVYSLPFSPVHPAAASVDNLELPAYSEAENAWRETIASNQRP